MIRQPAIPGVHTTHVIGVVFVRVLLPCMPHVWIRDRQIFVCKASWVTVIVMSTMLPAVEV